MSTTRKSYRKGRKRIVCVMLSLTMVLSSFGGISWNAQDVYAETNDSKYENIMNPGLPTDYDADDKTNPYTNDNKKFLFAENNELTVYKSWDVNEHNDNPWISTFDNYTNEGSMKIASSSATTKAGWESVDSITADKATIQELNYQDCVAFDPSGSGRKDHVAYVGYKNKHNYIWVYDTVNKKASDLIELPNSYEANNLNYITSRNFYTITAGDYNDDGKDTIVVYNVAEQNGFSILEYSYNKSNSSFSKLSSSQRMLHGIYRNRSNIYSSTNGKNKLGCNLTTGDFDGDGVEDLGVISYGQEAVSSDGNYRLFTPMVAAVFGEDQDGKSGGSNWSVVESGTMQTTYVALNKVVNNDNDAYDSMRSPSISGGDIDGDGADELVCSGFWCKVQDDGTNGKYNKAIDYDNITVAAVSARKDSINISGQKLGLKAGSDNEKNVWTAETTRRHSSDYETKIQLATECVAINGQNAAEKIFINGSIYEYDGVFNRAYTGNYFRSGDDYVDRSEVAAAGVTDVAVGVFDGNIQGREQVMFVTTLKEWGNGSDYFITMGAIGGKDYNDATNEARNYYTSNMDGDHYSLSNNGDSTNEMLNFCLAASDNDDDGLLGSYKTKTCVYNDPKVAAVLQAGPYFENLDDIGGYADPCETTYYMSTSYEKGKSNGHSVSFGAGFAGSLAFDAKVSFEANLRVGYSLAWNKNFEKSVATTYGTSFVAQGQDQVIISRIPVTVYCYDVYEPKGNNTYELKEEGYTIAVPGKPVYYQLNVEEYNEFATEYNNELESVESDTIQLKKICKDEASSDGIYDLPADNEGQPQNYWSSWAAAGEGATNLSQSPIALTYSSGHAANEWNTSTSTTESREMDHGFSFELEIMIGKGALGNHVRLGGYASLEYLYTSGSFKTETKEKGVSGQVVNLDEKALMNAGLTSENVRAYGFQWEFGTWKRELTTVSGDYTPFFGYRVWNVTMPAKAPQNLKAYNSDTDGLHSVDLEWDPVAGEGVVGYNVYIKDGSDYTKINEELVTGNSYTATGLDTNTNYTFVVTTQAYIEVTKQYKDKIANSVWSEEASISTPRDVCQITLTHDRGAKIIATSGGNEINSGDKILEGEAVSIEATANKGYNITKITLKKSDDSELDVTSTDGKFCFVVKGDTEIIVNAKAAVDESKVIYNNSSNGSIVLASSNGISFNSGAMINANCGDVTLEAKPNTGFVLKEWQVTTGDTTQSVAANGSNTYTFVPYEEQHEIIPIFVSEDDPSVNRTIQVDSSKGGSITIEDNDGKVYEPTEGKITVNIGTPIKIRAVADKYYTLKAWTGDVSIVPNTTKEIERTIYEDMTIGAEFFAPVKYKVTYNVNDKQYGTIKSNVLNNTSYVKEDVLEFKATPNKGYRLDYWEVKIGNDIRKIETKELKSEYDLKLNLEDTTTVTAYFTEIEKFKLTLVDSDYGTIKVVNQDGEELNNGDTYSYGDELTLTATPQEDYRLSTFKMNDVSIKNGYKTVVYEDINVEAQYARIINNGNTSGGGQTNPGQSTGGEGNTDNNYPVTGIIVTPDKAILTKVGDSVQLNAEVLPISAINKNVTWTSSNEAVAVVDNSGKVTAVGNGTATITATTQSENKVANAVITVSIESDKETGNTNKPLAPTDSQKPTTTPKKVTPNYRTLRARTSKQTNTTVTLQWAKVNGADGYLVYGSKCNTKNATYTVKLLKTIKGNNTLTWTHTKLNKATFYKYIVRAYKVVNGKKVTIAQSVDVHTVTKGGKYCVASRVNVTKLAGKKVSNNSLKLTVNKGKTAQITASETPSEKNKKIARHKVLCYESSNSKVATVSKSGTIKAVGKGTCYIWVYAQNGVYKFITITVK